MNNLKIAIVDDHQLFRKGLKGVLEDISLPGVSLFEGSNGMEAIELAIAHQPHLIFMDVSMPVLNGYDASKRILSLFPDIRIIALTTFDDVSLIVNLFRLGAKGFLSKNIEVSIIEEAIRTVLVGDYYYHSKYDEIITRWLKADLEVRVHSFEFTAREVQLVLHISKGYTSQQIAEQLKLSPHSIETYRKGLMEKVGVSNTSELISFFYRTGVMN